MSTENLHTTETTVIISDRHTGERWTYAQPSRAEARRLALRMRRAGYVATFGKGAGR